MSTRTSFDGLYVAIGTVLNRATGRRWWRKGGIKGQPEGTYATVYLSTGEGLQSPQVEDLVYDTEDPAGHIVLEIPWGTLYIECQVDFYRNAANDTVLQAATRFSNGLRLRQRIWDLELICGISGATRIVDISGMFRADVEPRSRVTFRFYANVVDPVALMDTKIYDIRKQPITLIRGSELVDEFAILDTGEIIPWPTT